MPIHTTAGHMVHMAMQPMQRTESSGTLHVTLSFNAMCNPVFGGIMEAVRPNMSKKER